MCEKVSGRVEKGWRVGVRKIVVRVGLRDGQLGWVEEVGGNCDGTLVNGGRRRVVGVHWVGKDKVTQNKFVGVGVRLGRGWQRAGGGGSG